VWLPVSLRHSSLEMAQSSLNYRGIAHRWSEIAIATGVALCINLLIFLFIPFLSEVSLEKKASQYIEAFRIQTTRIRHRARPLEERPRPPKPKKMPKIPPPKAIATRSLHKATVQPPQMKIEMPKFKAASGNMKYGTMEFRPPAPPQTEFDIGQVDKMPQVISRIRPIYPLAAKQKNIQGVVVLKFMVTKEGTVRDVSVLKAKPKGYFEKAAMDAVKKWKFRPGTVGKEPVNTWMTAMVKFRLDF
jgi:protein TonB